MENELKEPAFKYNYLSAEEYLDMERKAVEKTELYEGLLIKMTGASIRHNEIISNLVGIINPYLRGKSCSIYANDMRVHIPESNSFLYPDLTIVCGKAELFDDYLDNVLNPSVIIEVLSPSTENYDRGNKLFVYQKIQSLKEYILIDSAKAVIQVITKEDNLLWKFETITDSSSAFSIKTISLDIKLEDVYDKVEF
jgi:Uma2 family endonuclease